MQPTHNKGYFSNIYISLYMQVTIYIYIGLSYVSAVTLSSCRTTDNQQQQTVIAFYLKNNLKTVTKSSPFQNDKQGNSSSLRMG